jgi:riboflavin transporter FmnP
MENRLDMETATAITAASVFMISVYLYMALETGVPDYLEVQICAIIVTVMAAIYGMAAGILIPLVSYIAVHLSYPRSGALTGMLFLIFIGAATGHYAGQFRIREGRFKGKSLADYAVIETVLAVIVWVCMQPICSFFIDEADLRTTLNNGIMYCGISVVNELCICLPVILLANRLYGKRQEAMKAGEDYLYERE